MSTRNILDSLGNTIGTITLPDETSESTWTSLLSPYSSIVSTSPLPNLLESNLVSESNSTTTSAGVSAVVGTLSITPASGTYLVDFNGNAFTAGASAQGEFGIYVNGVLLPETRRDIKCNLTLLGGLVSISLNTIGVGTCTGSQIVLNGTQVVSVQFKSNNGGTIGFAERVFRLLKVQ